jgi:chitinase
MRHKITTLFLASLAVMLFTQCKPSTKTEKQHIVLGYVAGWTGMGMDKVDATKLTHINYAFANLEDCKSFFELDHDSLFVAQLNEKKAQNPELKVLVSIGGWIWSKNFSDAALTDSTRALFAQNAIQLMLKHNLDGIDLDWEYPGQIGDNNVFRPEDKENFTLMLKEIRQQLDQLPQSSNKHYLLTIATGANKDYTDNTNLGEAQKYLDFINIMTYDLYSGLDTITGHHANLNASPRTTKAGSDIHSAVDGHINAGVPAEKIVLGIPFYGRLWTGVSDGNNGLYQPAKSVGTIIDYHIIVDNYLNKGFERFWDEDAQAPYIWNADSAIFISYEDTESLELKLNYIEEKGLAGAMFWEYSLDKDDQLLNTIDKKLGK